MLLLGRAVDCFSLSESSSIEILDGGSFRFLLPIDAFSRGKESIKRKGIYSPRHFLPTEDPILSAPTSWSGSFELGALLFSKLGCSKMVFDGGFDGGAHQKGG
jgi:hypothetical protein